MMLATFFATWAEHDKHQAKQQDDTKHRIADA